MNTVETEGNKDIAKLVNLALRVGETYHEAQGWFTYSHRTDGDREIDALRKARTSAVNSIMYAEECESKMRECGISESEIEKSVEPFRLDMIKINHMADKALNGKENSVYTRRH